MDAHVRLCTLRLPTGAFSCSSSEYCPQVKKCMCARPILSQAASRRDVGGENSPPNGAAGYKIIKARGGKPLRACVYYCCFRRCQGREKFLPALQVKIFRRNSLTKHMFERATNKQVWEREGVTPSQRGCGGITPPQAKIFRRYSLTKQAQEATKQ